jgi:small-conductance mechanosensitive channel
MKSLLEYQLLAIGTYTLTVANVLGVLLVWGVTWFILRLSRRWIHRGQGVDPADQGRRYSLYLIVRYFVWTMAIVAMMETAGFHISVLLAGSAALLVGLGLGVQQIFRDIMSGIFLLFEGTIQVGDILQVNNQIGRVIEINMRTSKLVTRDGTTLIVPNNNFISESVSSWTHLGNEPSRYSVVAYAGYEAAEQTVREIILRCAGEHPDVLLTDPARSPIVRLTEFGEKRITYELLFWSYRKWDADTVRSELRFSIRKQFEAAKINMKK